MIGIPKDIWPTMGVPHTRARLRCEYNICCEGVNLAAAHQGKASMVNPRVLLSQAGSTQALKRKEED